MNEKTKKIGSMAIAAVVGAGAMFGGAALTDTSVGVEQINQSPITLTKIVEVEKEVIVTEEVEVIKYVDNEKLSDFMDYIFERDGDVTELTDDLEADEVDKIADRIAFVIESVKLGSDEIKKELADEIDGDEFVNAASETITFDEDDIERIKISDDLDDVVLSDYDFDDGELTVTYSVDFEQDDVDYTCDVEIEFKDGELDDISVSNISEE